MCAWSPGRDTDTLGATAGWGQDAYAGAERDRELRRHGPGVTPLDTICVPIRRHLAAISSTLRERSGRFPSADRSMT
jgi:hypothetical protein